MRDNKAETGVKRPKINNLTIITVVTLLTLVVVALIIHQVALPTRSVAGYCKVYKQEKARLAKLPGDTYPSLLFDHPLSNAGEFAKSLDRLEKVAPKDIDPDIKTLASLYKKLDADPSQMVSVSFAAESVDGELDKWTVNHCNK